MTDCCFCNRGVWEEYGVTPVGCSASNAQEYDQGRTTPIESPCPDFMREVSMNNILVCGISVLENKRWEIYVTEYGLPSVHLVTVLCPLMDNPLWNFHLPLKQSDITMTTNAFDEAKQAFEERIIGYGSVSG